MESSSAIWCWCRHLDEQLTRLAGDGYQIAVVEHIVLVLSNSVLTRVLFILRQRSLLDLDRRHHRPHPP